MKALAIIGAAAAALLVLFFWCACRVGGTEDERCGWR